MEYTWTPKRSGSLKVGLRQPRFMKFDNLSDCVDFTNNLSKDSKLLQPPLTAMFKADFEWERTAMHQASFDKLKQAMTNATHLSAINPLQPYHSYTDASKDCVGARLRSDVRMGSTREILDILPLCRGRCNVLKLDTRFESRSCSPLC